MVGCIIVNGETTLADSIGAQTLLVVSPLCQLLPSFLASSVREQSTNPITMRLSIPSPSPPPKTMSTDVRGVIELR